MLQSFGEHHLREVEADGKMDRPGNLDCFRHLRKWGPLSGKTPGNVSAGPCESRWLAAGRISLVNYGDSSGLAVSSDAHCHLGAAIGATRTSFITSRGRSINATSGDL